MKALEKEMSECKKAKRAVDHLVKQDGGLIYLNNTKMALNTERNKRDLE